MTPTNTTTPQTVSPINPSLIPNHVREGIGLAGLRAVVNCYKDPENERRFQAWDVEYQKRQANSTEGNAQKGR